MNGTFGVFVAVATALSSCSSAEAEAPVSGAPEAACGSIPCDPTHLPDGAPAPSGSKLTLTLEPNAIALTQGSSADVSLVVTRSSDLVEPLALEFTDLPLSAGANSAPIPGDRTRASFRLSVGVNTPPGKYTVTVTVRGTANVATAQLALSVSGASGALDTSFATGGRATSGVGFIVQNLGVQPDGHIVLGGTAGTQPVRDMVAVRFNALGVADAAFGASGSARYDFGGDEVAGDALVQRDGKVVLAGTVVSATGTSSAQTIGRFNVDGTPDTTFAGTGKLALSPSQFNSFNGLHQQLDGKLVASGGRYTGVTFDCAVTRITPQGALDPTFGAGGYVTLDMNGHENCSAVTTDAQGRVVVAARRGDDNLTDYLASGRFTAAGALDTSYASPNGWVIGAPIGGVGSTVLVQPDGKVLIGGSGPNNSKPTLGPLVGVVHRYGNDGVPDLTFGHDGRVGNDIPTLASIQRIALDSVNRIVVVGRSSADDATSKAVVARLMADGKLDATFGQGGVLLLDFTPGGADFGVGLALLPDGRMLIGGYSQEKGVSTPWVAKIWP